MTDFNDPTTPPNHNTWVPKAATEAIVFRGAEAVVEMDARRKFKAQRGWLRLTPKDRGLVALDGVKVVWVAWSGGRRRPSAVGVSEKVGSRLAWVRSKAKKKGEDVWTKVAVSSKGDVERRATGLAMRWGLPLPRDRRAVESMLETKAARATQLEAPPKDAFDRLMDTLKDA